MLRQQKWSCSNSWKRSKKLNSDFRPRNLPLTEVRKHLRCYFVILLLVSSPNSTSIGTNKLAVKQAGIYGSLQDGLWIGKSSAIFPWNFVFGFNAPSAGWRPLRPAAPLCRVGHLALPQTCLPGQTRGGGVIPKFCKHLAPIMILLLKSDMPLLDNRPSKSIANCSKA